MINAPYQASRLFRLCLIFITCFCLGLHAEAAAEFKIITLQHRFAEDILPAIQPLVGSGGTASAMQNNLIIRTSAENMAEIEQLISTLDTARQNLKITVNRNKSTNADKSNANMTIRKRIGNIVVETDSRQRTARDGASLNVENRQVRSNSLNSQFIQVIDGEKAFISVGQSIPYTQEWVSLTHRYISTQRTTEFIAIDTGFSVRPRTIGNLVELEITPRFSQLNQRGTIDFEALTTTIRASRGEWVDLAGIMLNKDDVSRAILSWQSDSQSSDGQLFIKVE
ncbi:secretin N-terminal domain-containing protein [Methylotenera sp. G11]|uniref:secretin N-terminal domain-containing protein n=1 Tax=Methylotenera sp. G11 TaxID=1506585 RepID=UPI0009DD8590|nr:secretin N-terminal domain-containing protein [Methylotenera sp. G11]